MDDVTPAEHLRLIQVEYPETLQCEELLESELPEDWRANLEITQNAGDHWLQWGKSALVSVPSAVIPSTRNFLLNPQHSDGCLVTVREHLQFELDPRLKQLAGLALSYRE